MANVENKLAVVRILLVDDEDDLHEILEDQLSVLEVKIGDTTYTIEVDHAVNGKDGLAKTEAGWYDAVLTDINMPEMSGIEFLAALRGAGNDVPVVVLTGYGDKAKSVEALRLGCYAFLDKPWKADYLRRVMKSAIEQGVAMRGAAEKVDSQVASYAGLPDPRKRQLRGVFRSMMIGGDGLHRSDICVLNDPKKKTI